MNSEFYNDKRRELQTSSPFFSIFTSTIGLMAAAMLLIEWAS